MPGRPRHAAGWGRRPTAGPPAPRRTPPARRAGRMQLPIPTVTQSVPPPKHFPHTAGRRWALAGATGAPARGSPGCPKVGVRRRTLGVKITRDPAVGSCHRPGDVAASYPGSGSALAGAAGHSRVGGDRPSRRGGRRGPRLARGAGYRASAGRKGGWSWQTLGQGRSNGALVAGEAYRKQLGISGRGSHLTSCRSHLMGAIKAVFVSGRQSHKRGSRPLAARGASHGGASASRERIARG